MRQTPILMFKRMAQSNRALGWVKTAAVPVAVGTAGYGAYYFMCPESSYYK